jgi:hypothetical protein
MLNCKRPTHLGGVRVKACASARLVHVLDPGIDDGRVSGERCEHQASKHFRPFINLSENEPDRPRKSGFSIRLRSLNDPRTSSMLQRSRRQRKSPSSRAGPTTRQSSRSRKGRGCPDPTGVCCRKSSTRSDASKENSMSSTPPRQSTIPWAIEPRRAIALLEPSC